MKSVRIRSYSGPYSVRMYENADQNNTEQGHFLRVVKVARFVSDLNRLVTIHYLEIKNNLHVSRLTFVSQKLILFQQLIKLSIIKRKNLTFRIGLIFYR